MSGEPVQQANITNGSENYGLLGVSNQWRYRGDSSCLIYHTDNSDKPNGRVW